MIKDWFNNRPAQMLCQGKFLDAWFSYTCTKMHSRKMYSRDKIWH